MKGKRQKTVDHWQSSFRRFKDISKQRKNVQSKALAKLEIFTLLHHPRWKKSFVLETAKCSYWTSNSLVHTAHKFPSAVECVLKIQHSLCYFFDRTRTSHYFPYIRHSFYCMSDNHCNNHQYQ